jgi:hypothetical protein
MKERSGKVTDNQHQINLYCSIFEQFYRCELKYFQLRGKTSFIPVADSHLQKPIK